MDNYALVIDISSDEEEQRPMTRQSTPMRAVPVNVIATLDLSGSSLEATKGRTEDLMSSVNELNLSNISASTLETIGSPRRITFGVASLGEAFTVEGQTAETSEDRYYEEPDIGSGRSGTQSRPAPGRDFSCCGGIPKFARGRGHGRAGYN